MSISTGCILNSGYPIAGCKGQNSGGIQYLYLAQYTSTGSTAIQNLVSSSTDELGVVIPAANATFYTFDLTKQTSSFSEKLTANLDNDTLGYEPEIKLIINRLSSSVRNKVKVLAQSKLMAIIKDNNGLFYLSGLVNGLDLGEGTESTGTKLTDRSGYELTFKGFEPSPVTFITGGTSFFTTSY